MSRISRSRLLATSAVVGLSIAHLASPANAQQVFGIHNNTPELLEIDVAAGETITGDDIGIYADNGPVVVDNAGTIRGNGLSYGSIDDRPSGGIVIAQPGSTVTNSGQITGAANGVTTSYFFSEDEEGDNLPPEALAANTTVTNSGLIRGEAGSGVALIGGGDVINSGLIQGFNGNVGNGAQGIGVVIAQYPEAVAEGVTGVGSLTNSLTGMVEGQLFGVLLWAAVPSTTRERSAAPEISTRRRRLSHRSESFLPPMPVSRTAPRQSITAAQSRASCSECSQTSSWRPRRSTIVGSSRGSRRQSSASTAAI